MDSSVCLWSETSCTLQGFPTSMFYINLHDHIVQDLVLVMPFLTSLFLPLKLYNSVVMHILILFFIPIWYFYFVGLLIISWAVTSYTTFLLHCSMQLLQLMENYTSLVEVVMDDTCLTFRYLVDLMINFSCLTIPSIFPVL